MTIPARFFFIRANSKDLHKFQFTCTSCMKRRSKTRSLSHTGMKSTPICVRYIGFHYIKATVNFAVSLFGVRL